MGLRGPKPNPDSLWKMPEFQAWKSMIARCTKPHNPGFQNYGARGIGVCERWRGSFSAFLSDMGRRPSPKHSIDRINNDGSYEPANCRWATKAEQVRNMRNNRWITFNGQTLTVTDWANALGIKQNSLQRRLKAHTLEIALSPGYFSKRHRIKPLPTHCRRGHEFTPENTMWELNPPYERCRMCRTCFQEKRIARRAAKKEKERVNSSSNHQ